MRTLIFAGMLVTRSAKLDSGHQQNRFCGPRRRFSDRRFRGKESALGVSGVLERPGQHRDYVLGVTIGAARHTWPRARSRARSLFEKMGLWSVPPAQAVGLPSEAPVVGRQCHPTGNASRPPDPQSLQEKLILKLKDQAATAITGGLSGLLVLLTVYKVVSSRESVLAESRKEQQRQTFERKARLAVMRRSLAGPARAPPRATSTPASERFSFPPRPPARLGTPRTISPVTTSRTPRSPSTPPSTACVATSTGSSSSSAAKQTDGERALGDDAFANRRRRPTGTRPTSPRVER